MVQWSRKYDQQSVSILATRFPLEISPKYVAGGWCLTVVAGVARFRVSSLNIEGRREVLARSWLTSPAWQHTGDKVRYSHIVVSRINGTLSLLNIKYPYSSIYDKSSQYFSLLL
jgi:hypothetical protein